MFSNGVAIFSKLVQFHIFTESSKQDKEANLLCVNGTICHISFECALMLVRRDNLFKDEMFQNFIFESSEDVIIVSVVVRIIRRA